jgi:hypothetical protein
MKIELILIIFVSLYRRLRYLYSLFPQWPKVKQRLHATLHYINSAPSDPDMFTGTT